MIARLHGRLLEKHPNRVIIDVNGVGYDVHVPLSTFSTWRAGRRDHASRAYTRREDALLLYGLPPCWSAALDGSSRQRHWSQARVGGTVGDGTDRPRRRDSHSERRELTVFRASEKDAERIGLELKTDEHVSSVEAAAAGRRTPTKRAYRPSLRIDEPSGITVRWQSAR